MQKKNTPMPRGAANRQPPAPPPLRAVDFFCGGGGMSQGFEKAGIQVIAALDNDPDCRATYEANHPDSAFLQRDITTYLPQKLANDLKKSGKPIEKDDDNMVFIACSPCQYWSIINGGIDSTRKAKSRASMGLLGHFKRFVRYFRPGYIVIENVRGIKSHAEKSGLNDFMRFLKRKGYTFESKVLSVADYNVPQTRNRYVMLASRVGEINLPKKSKKQKTVRDAFSKPTRLKPLEAGGQDPKDPLHRAAKLSPENIERLQLTPEGGGREGWANIDRLLIPAYRGKPITFFRENFGRMHRKEPAPTITTKFTSIGCGRFGHPKQDRVISLREGARLQTFPDSYDFKATSMQATAKLIGNAVPPDFAWRLALQVKKSAKNSYKQLPLFSANRR